MYIDLIIICIKRLSRSSSLSLAFVTPSKLGAIETDCRLLSSKAGFSYELGILSSLIY